MVAADRLAESPVVAVNLSAELRVSPGPVDLAAHDPRATPLAPGKKKKTRKALSDQGTELSDLQRRLYAAGTTGDRRVLLVLQGMDTSGKGGVIRHVIGLLDPQGCQVAAFKRPTEQELRHHFLWRVRRQLPRAGQVGVFDRSHYEDVLIGRVRELAAADVIEGRYAEIVRFERRAAREGAVIVKCFLHISPDRQRERLLARLDEPTKQWKFNPNDVVERRLWPAYRRAYEIALERCDSDEAPWYIVPSDRKWYRNWAVGRLLLEALTDLDPQYPPIDYDPDEQRCLVESS